ncbi:hypothetical protein IPC733_05570 [Pseudomonas aeruginosa]|uniref:hypothetical protein n=1 Tax=Pseudomonas aeruginosa TaxID=287 RepID=UPI0009A7A205|nr:hypothetical protein [Pseudomonas aeruginosa]RPX06846.1 hypothetical protein IPC733_05570 [Pseudomonas aeruginosa]SUD18579.1 Uncharacterised protein [Pseudomonas aeruginosa]
MSSTQHQLIEQCAARLRGIVEALDNIHDNTPRRWSTELDDVHSSAESLLALIKDQAPARSEASFEEWLANELEGEDGQPVPAAVCDIALARRAFNHWPKLEQPAKVGGVRFSAGVSSRLVVEAAQRLYEFESTPEKEAERIERLQAFREQLDPLNLAPHAEAFNEAPDEALRPEQAEAERPEVVAFRYHCTNAEGEPLPGWFYSDDAGTLGLREPLMTVAQHERIVGALRAERDGAIKLLGQSVWQKIERLTQERDAALARVEQQERTIAGINEAHAKLAGLYEAAQAQHSAGYAEARQCVNCRHIGINDAADYAACHDCRWTGPEPDEDKCPGCAGENCMAAACPECGGRYELVAEAKISTPAAQAGQMPQAWLDVQAERRRQITAEGWTPEHDDEHSHGQIARAAACYALAGSSAPNDGTAALLVSLAWPWDQQWWKPTSARRDLIKAGALILAEIERLDRAAPGKEVGHE